MSWRGRFPTLVISLLLLGCSTAFAQSKLRVVMGHDLDEKDDLPVEQWLSQGERTEIPLKFSLSKPELTFQLRNMVHVDAEIDTIALRKRGIQGELRYIVKIAPKNGTWSEPESYRAYPIGQELRLPARFIMRTVVLLQPGDYTIAAIIYNPVSGKRSLFIHSIQVKGPTAEGATELTSGLPDIDFQVLSALRSKALSPVKTQRPIQFDLVVDLSTRDEREQVRLTPTRTGLAEISQPSGGSPTPNLEQMGPSIQGMPMQRIGTASQQTREQSTLLAIANVLAELDFQPGCARVTALDVLRLHTILPPTPVNAVDWQQLRKGNTLSDKVVVSITSLEGRKNAGEFLQEQIRQIMARPPQCQPDSVAPLHVIAILSHGIRLPRGSKKTKIEAECNCKIFYFRETDPKIGDRDDLITMLEPLSPKRLPFSGPQDFRERLFELAEIVKKSP